MDWPYLGGLVDRNGSDGHTIPMTGVEVLLSVVPQSSPLSSFVSSGHHRWKESSMSTCLPQDMVGPGILCLQAIFVRDDTMLSLNRTGECYDTCMVFNGSLVRPYYRPTVCRYDAYSQL